MLTNQFPGVHVKEIPSGARPIASISTSTTAFLDVFKKGPIDEAVRLTSMADFETTFGGVWAPSEASYAIRHYFLNGGAVAYVVRVVAEDSGILASESSLEVKDELDQTDGNANVALTITALTSGEWGDDIRVAIGARTAPANSYDLLIREYKDSKVIAEEIFQNLSSVVDDPRFVDTVVNGSSKLVAVAGTGEMPAFGVGNPLASTELEGAKDLTKENLLPLVDGENGYVEGVAGWEAALATALVGSGADRTGLHALENIVPDIFNMMCIPVASNMPPANATTVYEAAEKFCRDRFAFLFVDPSEGATHSNVHSGWFSGLGAANSRNAAGYFPRLKFDDPENPGTVKTLGPSGMVAGMTARIDSSRGVWKSAAGTETRFAGGEPDSILTDLEQEPLNRLGVNALRTFPVYGNIIWGARTLVGADDLADEYKYVAVRRTALFIQQSLQRGLKWTVFEGNDETLWGQIRLNVGTFMQGLHRQGAFQGTAASDAYLVKCDGETTTQGDIDLGIVNILVAFAPLKPAEFVVLNFKQLTMLPE